MRQGYTKLPAHIHRLGLFTCQEVNSASLCSSMSCAVLKRLGPKLVIDLDKLLVGEIPFGEMFSSPAHLSRLILSHDIMVMRSVPVWNGERVEMMKQRAGTNAPFK